MSGSFQSPSLVAKSMASQVGVDDACVECGYQFFYELEGCDACLPITELLKLTNRTRTEET